MHYFCTLNWSIVAQSEQIAQQKQPAAVVAEGVSSGSAAADARAQAVEIDVEKVLRDKMGKKARYVPRFVVRWLKKIIHQDDMNGFFRAHKDEEGVEWLRSVIEYSDIKVKVVGRENLPAAGSGRYTFASNHPLGGIDGVTLGMILGEHYDSQIRYLLNDILMNLPGLRPLGIPVNKTGAQGRETPKMVDEVFASDYQVILFPAGLCSRRIKGKVQDLPWRKTVVQKSVQNHRDVVPIYFGGQNSKRFYRIANWSKRLGLKVNIAMLFLVDELYKNMHKEFEVHIGKPIPWQTFSRERSYSDWAQWLRGKVYELPDLK